MRTPVLILIMLTALACNTEDRLPKEARQPIAVVVERFDQDLFAMDTLQMDMALQGLSQKYPDFFPGYLTAVLGIHPNDPRAMEAVSAFLASYRPVYHAVGRELLASIEGLPAEMERALQWMRYLVPGFRPDEPFVITTFIGPMDAYESFSIGDHGDVRTANGVGIALQLHLGSRHPLYESGLEGGVFFDYQVRRFEPGTMLVNAMKNVIEDQFPYTAAGKPLIEEMVEKGKRMYLLKKVLPQVHDSLLVGYTGAQWKGCLDNESTIWQFFVKNDLLYSIEPSINQQYIRDGPKTPELGEASPGYIGLFIGWRIVEAFMNKNPGTSIDTLMDMPANNVFQASGYRPS